MIADIIQWVVRAVLIIVAVILAIVILKGKRQGRYQRISLRFFTIGITALAMGIILLIVSALTDLSFYYDVFLTVSGAVIILMGLIVRITLDKNR